MNEQSFQRLKQENVRLKSKISQLEDELARLSSLKGFLKHVSKKIILKLDYFGFVESHKGQLKQIYRSLFSLRSPSLQFSLSQKNLSKTKLSEVINSPEIDALMCLRLIFSDATIEDSQKFIESFISVKNILCIDLTSNYFHLINLLLRMNKELTLVECHGYKGIPFNSLLDIYESTFDSWLAMEQYGSLNEYSAILISKSCPERYFNLLSGRLSSRGKIFVLPLLT